MTALLLDTHVWAWSLTGDSRLTASAISQIEQATIVYISPISFFEIGQKVRLGKWDAMKPFMPRLADLLQEQGGSAATLTPEICAGAAMLDWDHRDPFDRLIAASALQLGVPLVSADAAFDGVVRRVW